MLQSLIAFCEALSETQLSLVIQEVRWVIPMVQTVHILAIAVVVGSVGMLNLRLLGIAARSQSISGMVNRLTPPVWVTLVVLLATGAILAIGEPVRSLANPAFHLKMLLLLLAMALTAYIQHAVRKDVAFWELSPQRRLAAKLTGLVSLLCWVGIVFAGRWIAYMDLAFG